MILGLDLSSVNSGYSVLGLRPSDGEDLISQYNAIIGSFQTELISYGNIVPNKKFNHAAKLQFIYENVKGLIERFDIKVVVMEDQHFRANVDTLKLLARIGGVAMLAAQQSGCQIYLYPAPTIKKSFTGDGKAHKEDMIKTAVEKFNVENIDDNVADSIGVAYTYVVKELRKE